MCAKLKFRECDSASRRRRRICFSPPLLFAKLTLTLFPPPVMLDLDLGGNGVTRLKCQGARLRELTGDGGCGGDLPVPLHLLVVMVHLQEGQ